MEGFDCMYFGTAIQFKFVAVATCIPCVQTLRQLSYSHIMMHVNQPCRFPFLCQVDAVVLKLTPLVKPTIDVDYRTLETVVKSLFQYRRKYIRNGARYMYIVSNSLLHSRGRVCTKACVQCYLIYFIPITITLLKIR